MSVWAASSLREPREGGMALADIWRKTLIYFGIAEEEEDDYYEEDTLAPHEELEQSYQERPNVKRIDRGGKTGRRRPSSTDFDDIFAGEEDRGSGGNKAIRPVPSPSQKPSVEVHLIVPKSFNDAQLVADKFKKDVPVIINLQSSEKELSKRLIDFTSGLTYALDGGMQRVADRVFLLTPNSVEVSAEQKQELMEKGFFNQY